MRIRHLVGHLLNIWTHAVLSAPWFPLTRYVRAGRHWMYDIQRFAGARDIGVVFDVGANVGQTAWGLTRYFRSSPIYCFEPVRATFEELQRKYGSKVHCVKLALGRRDSTETIQLHRDSELNSFGPTRPGKIGTETVKVQTVDKFCFANGIESIGLLKMDVQGWEMEVLYGAPRMLELKAIRFIFAEVGFRERDSDMQAFEPLNRYLCDLGYEFCGLYDDFRWGPSKLYVGFSNALYALPAASAPKPF